MKVKTSPSLAVITLLINSVLVSGPANAAIALDRTRVIFDGANKSMSLNISNENKELPYLAQGWIEDADGNKDDTTLMVIPPLQRVEAGAKSQLKIQAMPAAMQLPQDRESLFYFNLREIPPKSTKPNTLQIALQTRVKLFYRPKTLQATTNDYANPWQMKLTLVKQGDKYRADNPTPYYISLVAISFNGKDVADFKPVMIAPHSHAMLGENAALPNTAPHISYINDFGGVSKLIFQCVSSNCLVKEHIPG